MNISARKKESMLRGGREEGVIRHSAPASVSRDLLHKNVYRNNNKVIEGETLNNFIPTLFHKTHWNFSLNCDGR